MNLNAFLLNEGKTYKNYYESNKDGKNKEFFKAAEKPERLRALLRQGDPTAKEDSVGNYSDWIIKNVIKDLRKEIKRAGYANHLDPWLAYKMGGINPILKYFEKNKSLFKNKDINSYSLASLKDEIEKIEGDKATNKMKGGKAIKEYNGWKIIEIKTHQQACKLGSGSKWCITMKDYPESFYKYKKFGPIFFVIKGNRRWAISGDASEENTFFAWDEKDKPKPAKLWREEESVPIEIFGYLYRRYLDESKG